MKAPDESGINKDCTEKSTDWIAPMYTTSNKSISILFSGRMQLTAVGDYHESARIAARNS